MLHSRYRGVEESAMGPFLAREIERERIEFIETQSLDDYLKTYNRIDVALDPFPYGGGTTTCGALWMGVPVVTLAGDAPSTRTGVSILSNVGLPELIASTTDEYISGPRSLLRNKVAEYRWHDARADVEIAADGRAGLRAELGCGCARFEPRARCACDHPSSREEKDHYG